MKKFSKKNLKKTKVSKKNKTKLQKGGAFEYDPSASRNTKSIADKIFSLVILAKHIKGNDYNTITYKNMFKALALASHTDKSVNNDTKNISIITEFNKWINDNTATKTLANLTWVQAIEKAYELLTDSAKTELNKRIDSLYPYSFFTNVTNNIANAIKFSEREKAPYSDFTTLTTNNVTEAQILTAKKEKETELAKKSKRAAWW